MLVVQADSLQYHNKKATNGAPPIAMMLMGGVLLYFTSF